MVDDDGAQYTGWLPHVRGPRLAISLIAFFTVLYPCAWVWFVYVENACGKAVQWIENRVFEEDFRLPARVVPVLTGEARV